MSRVLSMQQNELPGEPLSLRGVLFPFYFTLHCFVGTWAYAPQAGSLLIFLIVIQPFANEIRRYICQDRHEECHEDLQCSSPPSTAKESAAETVYQTCPDSTRFAARRKRKSHLKGPTAEHFLRWVPFSLSKKSSNGWAFSHLYGKIGLGDERCWNAENWIVAS